LCLYHLFTGLSSTHKLVCTNTALKPCCLSVWDPLLFSLPSKCIHVFSPNNNKSDLGFPDNLDLHWIISLGKCYNRTVKRIPDSFLSQCYNRRILTLHRTSVGHLYSRTSVYTLLMKQLKLW